MTAIEFPYPLPFHWDVCKCGCYRAYHDTEGHGCLTFGGPECQCRGFVPKSGSVVLAFDLSVAVTNRSGLSCR